VAGLRVINQYERGVRFTLGKYSGIISPGLNYIIPIIQTYKRVDIRQTTIDLKPQSVLSKDQVNLNIDGVVFYHIKEPEKVILNVENLKTQLSDKASSELKEIIGNMTMSQSLQEREKIAKELLNKLNDAIEDKSTKEVKDKKDWGIEIKSIQINNINLPQELIRAMSKQAEAEREKLARVIKAQGEYEASKKFEDGFSKNSKISPRKKRELSDARKN
jgi:regulator of protease activity HflC (stomatin/prohibitin superfamily)